MRASMRRLDDATVNADEGTCHRQVSRTPTVRAADGRSLHQRSEEQDASGGDHAGQDAGRGPPRTVALPRAAVI